MSGRRSPAEEQRSLEEERGQGVSTVADPAYENGDAQHDTTYLPVAPLLASGRAASALSGTPEMLSALAAVVGNQTFARIANGSAAAGPATGTELDRAEEPAEGDDGPSIPGPTSTLTSDPDASSDPTAATPTLTPATDQSAEPVPAATAESPIAAGPAAPPTEPAPTPGPTPVAAPQPTAVSGLEPVGGPAAPVPVAGAPVDPAVSLELPPDSGFAGGLDEVANRSRQSIEQFTTDATTRIRAAAANQRGRITQAAQEQAAQVDASFGQALSDLQAALATAQQRVTSERDAKIAEAGQAAAQAVGQLSAVASQQRGALLGAGADKAQAAIAMGEQQAARAQQEARLKSIEALETGKQKADEWRQKDRGELIARTAGEMAGAAARKITDAGAQTAAQARQDAAAVAGKIRQEAADAASSLGGSTGDAHARIEQIRVDAVSGIQALTDSTLSQLNAQAERLQGQLASQRADAVATIEQRGVQATDAIDLAEAQAAAAVDEAGASALTSLNQTVAQMAQQLSQAEPEQIAAALPQASAQLDSAVAALGADVSARAGDLEQSISAMADSAVSALATAADQICADSGRAPAQFTTAANQALAEVSTAIADRATEATTGMSNVVATYDTQLQRTVDDAIRTWTDELAQGTREITDKVDRALDGIREMATALPGKIDGRAHEIQSESWLSRGLHLLGGVLVGLLEGLWSLVKVVLVVVLVVVAVVALAVVIGAWLGGLAGALAVIGALIAIAEFLAPIVAVLLVIGLAVMIVVDLVKLIRAFRRGDLTDYERGKLIGGVAFDVLTVVFGEELVKPLQWLVEFMRGARTLEEARLMTELRALLRDDELLDRLLSSTGGDAKELRTLLTLVGDDGLALEELLILTDRDAGKLRQVLNLVGEDPAKAVELLKRARNADDLLALFAEHGGNVQQVEAALAAREAGVEPDPDVIGPERQLAPPTPPTAQERLAERRAALAEQARETEIREGIDRVDREIAAGTHRRRFSQDDLDWLNEDPRRKAIAYDPDIGTYRVSEARQAIAAEEAGVIPGPVSRSVEPGTDILDGSGRSWSFKGTGPGSSVESTADLIANEAAAGRPCLGDLRGMSMREQAAIRTMVVDRLAGRTHAEIRFLPPGIDSIPGT